MEEDVLGIMTQLNCLTITYDHKDWEQILLSSAKDISTPDVTITSNRMFPWIELRTVTELREGSLVVKLPEVQEASCSVSLVKFSMNSVFSESISILIIITFMGLKSLIYII